MERIKRAAACLLLLATAGQAQASIMLNATRLVYEGGDREVALTVHNTTVKEILVQAWLETEAGEMNPQLPFAVAPPLARMPGKGRQMLRVIQDGSEMPADRESVYWLSVQEIPQVASDNTLQIAIRQRIKLFYRPPGLAGDPARAARQLRWHWLDERTLQVINPGPFHVSLVQLEATQGSDKRLVEEARLLQPWQQEKLVLSPASSRAPLRVNFLSINDYGGAERYRLELPEGAVASPVRVSDD